MRTSKALFLITIIGSFVVSCTDSSNEIHIDEGKKAIVACNGNSITEVRIDIDGPDVDVEYKGADTIFFNRKNTGPLITVFSVVNYDYILKLKPNSRYDIKSYSSNGDQGPYRIILKTDNHGNIIHDSENDCR